MVVTHDKQLSPAADSLGKVEAIKPYNPDGEKAAQVEAMFNHIAPTYDKLNHRLSWDIDCYWRKKAIKELRQFLLTSKAQHTQATTTGTTTTSEINILDIATGTGDFAILAAKMIAPTHRYPLLGRNLKIIGADISEGMMAIGRQKVERAGLQDKISFANEDCCALSFEENSFDAVIASFGIRNFQNLELGLKEMCRVLKPGGLLCILELTSPRRFPMRQLFHLYSHSIMPAYGRLISNDSAAYSYLTRSIEAFPCGEQMMGILQRAGFSETRFQRLTFGICTMYIAKK